MAFGRITARFSFFTFMCEKSDVQFTQKSKHAEGNTSNNTETIADSTSLSCNKKEWQPTEETEPNGNGGKYETSLFQDRVF